MSAHPSHATAGEANTSDTSDASNPVHRDHTSDADAIQRLAEVLATTAPAEALLVRLEATDRQAVGLVPLQEIDPLSEHPADFLLGFEAPPEWWGVGVVAHGHLRALPGDTDPPIDDAIAITVCQIATRDGLVGHGIAAASGDLPERLADTNLRALRGRIPDLLQRSLGRPVEACHGGTGAWIDQRWLDALVEHVAAAQATPTWGALARRHPLADRPAGGRHGRCAPAPEGLRALTRQIDGIGWERLIAADPVAAARSVGFTDPEHAGPQLLDWVGPDVVGDWMLGQLPRAADLFAALAALLPEPLLAKVEAALIPGSTT